MKCDALVSFYLKSKTKNRMTVIFKEKTAKRIKVSEKHTLKSGVFQINFQNFSLKFTKPIPASAVDTNFANLDLNSQITADKYFQNFSLKFTKPIPASAVDTNFANLDLNSQRTADKYILLKG